MATQSALRMKLVGADELLRTLQQVKLGVRNRVTRRAVNKAGRVMVPALRRATPRRRTRRLQGKNRNPPGTMRKSTGVVIRKYKDGGIWAAYVGHQWPLGAAAQLLIGGTKKRRTKKGANRGSVKKTDFMTPVVNSKRIQVWSTMRIELAQGLTAEIKKYAKKGKTVFK